MKAVFLTSNLGGYNRIVNGNEVEEQITKCDNSNYFVDRLKNAVPKIKNFVFIASDPECSSKTDKYANNIVKSLNLDGFGIENLIVLDHRFSESIENTILSADVVFLAGGNVLIQNKYFKEISLKSILTKFNGVLIGQSAGSMNCSKIVYNQPEEEEEFKDKNFKKKLSGLGLVNFSLMPHMNCADEVLIQGYPTVMEMCLNDSFQLPHYGIYDYGFIEINDNKITAYGKTLLIKNGEIIEICKDKENIELNNQCEFNL